MLYIEEEERKKQVLIKQNHERVVVFELDFGEIEETVLELELELELELFFAFRLWEGHTLLDALSFFSL
jgi:hypothetical protein